MASKKRHNPKSSNNAFKSAIGDVIKSHYSQQVKHISKFLYRKFGVEGGKGKADNNLKELFTLYKNNQDQDRSLRSNILAQVTALVGETLESVGDSTDIKEIGEALKGTEAYNVLPQTIKSLKKTYTVITIEEAILGNDLLGREFEDRLDELKKENAEVYGIVEEVIKGKLQNKDDPLGKLLNNFIEKTTDNKEEGRALADAIVASFERGMGVYVTLEKNPKRNDNFNLTAAIYAAIDKELKEINAGGHTKKPAPGDGAQKDENTGHDKEQPLDDSKENAAGAEPDVEIRSVGNSSEEPAEETVGTDGQEVSYDEALKAAWKKVKDFYLDIEEKKAKELGVLANGEERFKQHVEDSLKDKPIEEKVAALNDFANEDNVNKFSKDAPKTDLLLMEEVKKKTGELHKSHVQAKKELLKARYVDGKSPEEAKKEAEEVESEEKKLADFLESLLDVEKHPQYRFSLKVAVQEAGKEVDKLYNSDLSLKYLADNLSGAGKEAKAPEKGDNDLAGYKDIVAAVEKSLVDKFGDDANSPDVKELFKFIKKSGVDVLLPQSEVERIVEIYAKAEKTTPEQIRAAELAMVSKLADSINYQKTPQNVWAVGNSLPGGNKAKGLPTRVKDNTVNAFQTRPLTFAVGGAALGVIGATLGKKEDPEAPEEGKKIGFWGKVAIAVGSIITLGAVAAMVVNKRQGRSMIEFGGRGS